MKFSLAFLEMIPWFISKCTKGGFKKKKQKQQNTAPQQTQKQSQDSPTPQHSFITQHQTAAPPVATAADASRQTWAESLLCGMQS